HIENVLGLEYHWIPVSPETIDEEMAEKLIRTLDEAAKPTLIHDSNGNRVWGVWALYVGTKLGVPFEETQRVAKEHGIPRLVIDAFVRERLESAKK
ncbi:MAG TPA: hypothetical protein VK116_19800, partial [Planctomycetota bacterium]|nr:hypothetical protein [Planctomycetota bacterium]